MGHLAYLTFREVEVRQPANADVALGDAGNGYVRRACLALPPSVIGV